MVDEVISGAMAATATLVKKPQEGFRSGYRGYFRGLAGHPRAVAHNPCFQEGPADDGSQGG
jgi:hypothetical protein